MEQDAEAEVEGLQEPAALALEALPVQKHSQSATLLSESESHKRIMSTAKTRHDAIPGQIVVQLHPLPAARFVEVTSNNSTAILLENAADALAMLVDPSTI